MKIISLSPATETLASLKPDYITYLEMSPADREFLTALIQEYKPKKAVEIGVSAGGSSVVLLNALSKLSNNKLISVEYSVDYYRDEHAAQKRKSGFIVDAYPELKKNWTLHAGGMISDFTDRIGGDIDFCFIDTAHSLPGEILDFLAVFPFLKEDAVVVFHDTNLQTWDMYAELNVNNLLISALSGEKIIPEAHDKVYYSPVLHTNVTMPFANIAGVILDKNQNDRLWDVLNLLTQRWRYLPTPRDLDSFRNTLKKHYHPQTLGFFNEVVTYQEHVVNLLKQQGK